MHIRNDDLISRQLRKMERERGRDSACDYQFLGRCAPVLLLVLARILIGTTFSVLFTLCVFTRPSVLTVIACRAIEHWSEVTGGPRIVLECNK